MSKRVRARLLAATAGAGLVCGIAAPAFSETLAEAIALAYQTDPQLLAQQAVQRQQDEAYVQARAGWRPTLQIQAAVIYQDVRTPLAAASPASLFGQPVTRSHQNIGEIVITLNQPIWTGGRTAAAVSAAEAQVLQGRENLRRIEGQVMASAIQAYEDVRRDEQSLQIRQEDVGVLQQQLDQARARYDVGEVTRTDVAQASAQLAAVQAALEQARAQLAVSRANYAVLMGRNPGTLAPEPSLAYLLPKDVDDAFTVAEQNNPTLRGQEFAEQASRAQIAQARAERMPRLDLQIVPTYGGNAPLVPFNQGLFSRTIQSTVTLTIPVFTGGVTTSRIRASIEQNNVDRIDVEAQRRAVLQSITQSWSQLLAARANISSDTEQVKAAEVAAQGTKEELDQGLRTTIDVLNADIVLRSAQLNLIAARHDEYVAAAQVLFSMGRLEARDLIPTVPQYDPTRNFRKLRVTWGWVPWEEPLSTVDQAIAFPPIPHAHDLPREPAIGPGLQPPPPPSAVPRHP